MVRYRGKDIVYHQHLGAHGQLLTGGNSRSWGISQRYHEVTAWCSFSGPPLCGLCGIVTVVHFALQGQVCISMVLSVD